MYLIVNVISKTINDTKICVRLYFRVAAGKNMLKSLSKNKVFHLFNFTPQKRTENSVEQQRWSFFTKTVNG